MEKRRKEDANLTETTNSRMCLEFTGDVVDEATGTVGGACNALLHHGSVYHAGCDAVDRDAITSNLLGDRFAVVRVEKMKDEKMKRKDKRESFDSGLACHVCGAERGRVAETAGGDVDDAAVVVAHHAREHLVDGVEDAVDVAGKDRVPVGASHLVERDNGPWGTSVVHEHIDAPVARKHLRDHVLYVLLSRHICSDRNCLEEPQTATSVRTQGIRKEGEGKKNKHHHQSSGCA